MIDKGKRRKRKMGYKVKVTYPDGRVHYRSIGLLGRGKAYKTKRNAEKQA